eukprot:1257376-Prymnesium_polylepis.1
MAYDHPRDLATANSGRCRPRSTATTAPAWPPWPTWSRSTAGVTLFSFGSRTRCGAFRTAPNE